ncbi:uncharacterized protein PAC_10589 [Phialocephala subalpina]|uniref:Uncharacterized protein n=1 Tax=Phialocephala subalpina TaxID=576137 RepID=A0A1L7X6Q9_9HELO|nr:uncharacterized protein PAC_10589 [Phialocephala subalpina]
MSKKFSSKTLGRVFGRQQSTVGESSAGERALGSAGPTIRLGTASAAQQTVDLYSTEGDTGIRVIADPTDATLDIVFVHGLTGNRDKTWTHSNGVFWPQEIAEDIPTARIMTFGYDADVVKLWGIAGSNTLRNHGKNLAFDISDQRRGHRERPIIFIAHSLGGLVCEQALLICGEGDPNLKKVFQYTQGIIFMGTPHGGSGLATLGYTFSKYLKVVRHTNPAIIGVLQQKSELLTAVQQQFQQLLNKPEINISIYCFFEEKPIVGVGIIVSEQSAVLNQYPNQSIGANHMDMTKFSGRNDVGYQRVLNRLRDLMESMKSNPVTNISQEGPLIESDPNQAQIGNAELASCVLERGTPPTQTFSNAGSGTGTGIGSQNVQGGFHIHHGSHLDFEKGNKCHQLLRTSEYERHKERNPCSIKGTCQWFLKHKTYVTWRDSLTSSLLWVSADPGCGKSVLSKSLADKELQATKNRTICYFFFKDDNEDQKTATNALCALLHQLFDRKPELLSHAIEVYNQNGNSFTGNVDLLWGILIAAAADPKAGEIICILDALDECKQSELKYLLRKVCAFYEGHPRVSDNTTLKFLVTSRPLQHIADEFNDITQKLPTIRLAGEEDTDQIKLEIDLVIKAELEALQQQRGLDLEAISRLRQELTKFEHRTYLWLKLVFELIRNNIDSPTKKGRQKIFGSIPDSVNAAYTAILNQSTDKKQARKLLQIICTATRPLSVKEMSIAISIEPEDKTLKDLEIQSEEFSKNLIRNLCGLFVSVIDGCVYLLHQTAKEFLIGQKEISQPMAASDWIWKHSLSVKDSNFVFAHICVWYLRLEGFSLEYQYATLSETVAKFAGTYTFLEYAALNWAVHFREATIPMDHISIALALDICNPEAYPYKIWSLVFWRSVGYTYCEPPTKFSSLHLASLFGLQGVVGRLLVTQGIDVNAADSGGRTPLSEAICAGHDTVVGQLLGVPGIDVNAADSDGETPLYVAAERGYAAIVSRLLATPGIDVNAAMPSGRTPLIQATFNGHALVVGQLLAAPGININAMGEVGRTALWLLAAVQGIDIVKILIEKGVDVELTNNSGQTSLSWAASRGQEADVKLLLTKDSVEPDSKDRIGRTPLSYAAKNGNKAIVELLIATNRVNVDSKDYYGSTPLSIAARMGHKDVVAFLVTKGRNSNVKDTFGRTPLWWARRKGCPEIADLLETYKGNNITIREDELPISTVSVLYNQDFRCCDVCVLNISDRDTYYHCKVCCNGDFDICTECFAMKAHCLDESHVLVKREQGSV